MSRVQSIQRAFAVLGALGDGPLGVTDVADRARLPKSTAARLLSALQAEGAVEQVPGESRYRIGGRIASLAAGTKPGATVLAVAHPLLADLAAAVGEAAGLALAEGRFVRYVDQVDTTNAVRARDWTGTRVPMHAVPSGQVLLARLPDAELERYLELPRERFTANTLVDAAALRARLAQVRRDGYAWVREEFDLEINSVAAAVVVGGEARAAIHIHGPSYRFPRAGSERDVGGLVAAAARRMAGRLEGRDGDRGRGGAAVEAASRLVDAPPGDGQAAG